MALWAFLFGPDVTIIEYGTLSAKGRLLVNSFINGLNCFQPTIREIYFCSTESFKIGCEKVKFVVNKKRSNSLFCK